MQSSGVTSCSRIGSSHEIHSSNAIFIHDRIQGTVSGDEYRAEQPCAAVSHVLDYARSVSVSVSVCFCFMFLSLSVFLSVSGSVSVCVFRVLSELIVLYAKHCIGLPSGERIHFYEIYHGLSWGCIYRLNPPLCKYGLKI